MNEVRFSEAHSSNSTNSPSNEGYEVKEVNSANESNCTYARKVQKQNKHCHKVNAEAYTWAIIKSNYCRYELPLQLSREYWIKIQMFVQE